MDTWSEVYTQATKPTNDQISAYIGNPMWAVINSLIQDNYQVEHELQMILSSLSPYVQELYTNTKFLMDERWLMINITDENILQDV